MNTQYNPQPGNASNSNPTCGIIMLVVIALMIIGGIRGCINGDNGSSKPEEPTTRSLTEPSTPETQSLEDGLKQVVMREYPGCSVTDIGVSPISSDSESGRTGHDYAGAVRVTGHDKLLMYEHLRGAGNEDWSRAFIHGDTVE